MIAYPCYAIITMGCLVSAQTFFLPQTQTQPIGNQLSYEIAAASPNSFDIRRYSDRFDQNIIPNFASNQINVLPPQSVPFIPDVRPEGHFVDGTLEHSSGISSSIDVIAPPQQPNRPSTFSAEGRYVGMVSDITKNNIHHQTELNMPQQQRQQRPGLPPFLVGTSPEVQRKFFNIVSNRDETFQQKQNKLDDLMSKLDEKKQKMYNEFRRQKNMEETEKRAKIHALVSTMSQKAQTSFAKVSAVLTNPELKDGERWQMIQNVY
ncbi:unnamed protein product, partial [Toxocara canis]|uniref:DUF148 domain-containing protein n=1 Tax=Toxocara canis TaxID=6265 RepID=A0A183VFI3_TOXCA